MTLKQLTADAAVVTRVASGIRRAIGTCAAKLGSRDTGGRGGRGGGADQRVAQSLRDNGSDATATIADVRYADAMQEPASEVRVRSAPVSPPGQQGGYRHDWSTLGDTTRTVGTNVNVTGVHNGGRTSVPQMIAKGISAHIVSLASIGAVSIGPCQTLASMRSSPSSTVWPASSPPATSIASCPGVGRAPRAGADRDIPRRGGSGHRRGARRQDMTRLLATAGKGLYLRLVGFFPDDGHGHPCIPRFQGQPPGFRGRFKCQLRRADVSCERSTPRPPGCRHVAKTVRNSVDTAHAVDT